MEHKEELMEKSGLDERSFLIIFSLISQKIHFIPTEEYAHLANKAKNLIGDADDGPFIALALYLGVPLWTNDKKLKEQGEVRVYSTQEIIGLLH